MKLGLAFAVLLLGLCGSLFAQTPAGSPDPAAGGAAPPGTDPTTPFPDLLPPEPGTGYSYNPQGRRDPFVSLQRPIAADRGPKTRKAGVEGFLIQEIALKGIVRTGGGGLGVAKSSGYIALIVGPDPTKSYFVTTGQRLFDGVITAVDATSITIMQEVTDPLSPVKTREVKKSLYASEEARQ
jgi:Tfp pilus assembly protein PilP